MAHPQGWHVHMLLFTWTRACQIHTDADKLQGCCNIMPSRSQEFFWNPIGSSPIKHRYCSLTSLVFLPGVPVISNYGVWKVLLSDMLGEKIVGNGLESMNICACIAYGLCRLADSTHLFILRLDKIQSNTHCLKELCFHYGKWITGGWL